MCIANRVTSLIFNAKGNPLRQLLMKFIIQFAVWDYFIYLFVLWGDDYISWNDNADGNFALISWLKIHYNGNKAEVKS